LEGIYLPANDFARIALTCAILRQSPVTLPAVRKRTATGRHVEAGKLVVHLAMKDAVHRWQERRMPAIFG
jgi:hypothetical protein